MGPDDSKVKVTEREVVPEIRERRNLMKRQAIVGALLTAGISAALVSAPSAAATEQQYLRDLAANGVYAHDGTVTTLLQWGYEVCTDQRIGRAPATSMRNVYFADENTLTFSAAEALVYAALTELC
jgi:hypothetical protein